MQDSSEKASLSGKGVHSFISKQWKHHPLAWMIVASAIILFACSSLRHAMIQSIAWDLGIFDQVVYLISQGQQPISSLIDVHILGDHAAWIFYPLALLYKIYPDANWLLAVQAVALALGALPTWYLARHAGLKESQAVAMAAVYLLYPVVFNVNLFDFHPEVLALPALLGAILAARLDRIWWFCLAIVLVLGCKAILSLTVVALGFWLVVFEKKRLCGAIALFAGITWFIVANQVIIPHFNTHKLYALSRYSYLGDSIAEIVQNLLFKPWLIAKVVFALDNLLYLGLLLAPVIWGLSLRHLAPLVAAIPAVALNLLADYGPQKTLFYQYSIPVLPFLLVAAISTLASGGGWLRKPRSLVLWSLIFFLGVGRYGYFWTKYLPSLDTWQATREAIAKIETKGGVLTTDEIAPQVTHRPLVKLANPYPPIPNFSTFDYVLLNVRHPGIITKPEFAASLVDKLKDSSEFQLTYQRDDIYLFAKK